MLGSSSQTTVAAIATPRGQGGVAVIRVSGPQAWSIGRQIFSNPRAFEPGRFYHGWIIDPNGTSQETVDEVLLLAFKAPHSFTGEDVIEIHCHGGDFISLKILELCFEAGALPAQPGEFTKRAFLSGKLDLTQAESIMDLISAQSEKMLQLASGNLKNRALAQSIGTLGDQIIQIQAQIVAHVDFPEEVEEPDRAALLKQLLQLQQKVQVVLDASQRNRAIREGAKVALLGMPNSGKSSLFNAMLAAERAIVTDIPGTTRDVITEAIPIAGISAQLIDTAGIRATENQVEILGIEKSWEAATDAQAILYVYDATVGLVPEDQAILQRLQHPHVLLVANKMDLVSQKELVPQSVAVSAKTSEGMAQIFVWLETHLGQSTSTGDEMRVSLNQRQYQCLLNVHQNLQWAFETLQNIDLPLDLVTVPLTEGLRKLDELLGRETSEEVLTDVFSRFCVGK